MKLAAILLALLMMGVAAYGMWYQRQHPARVLAMGSVRAKDSRARRTLTLRTRSVEVGAVRKQEVEPPSGTWIGCGGDCADAVKRGYTEVWGHQERRTP